MKTNKEDIRLLKSKHRLELVMQETGESFEVDAAKPDLWHGTITRGLTVDIRRQMYEIQKPGMEPEAGDVLTWLQSRFNWSFAMAINYLKKRAPDPAQEARRVKVNEIKQPQQSDYVVISNRYVNPEAGVQVYGFEYNYSIMDDLQKRALDLWSGAVKYFDKSSDDVFYKMENYPKRFKPVVDFDIEKCANCEKQFNWKTAGTIAYAQEKEKWVSVAASNSDEGIEVNGCIQADGWEEIDKLFIDADFVICEKCMREIYAPRYAALKLVRRAARKREKARENEQKEFARERDEEERREREAEQERLANEFAEQAWLEGERARMKEAEATP